MYAVVVHTLLNADAEEEDFGGVKIAMHAGKLLSCKLNVEM